MAASDDTWTFCVVGARRRTTSGFHDVSLRPRSRAVETNRGHSIPAKARHASTSESVAQPPKYQGGQTPVCRRGVQSQLGYALHEAAGDFVRKTRSRHRERSDAISTTRRPGRRVERAEETSRRGVRRRRRGSLRWRSRDARVRQLAPRIESHHRARAAADAEQIGHRPDQRSARSGEKPAARESKSGVSAQSWSSSSRTRRNGKRSRARRRRRSARRAVFAARRRHIAHRQIGVARRNTASTISPPLLISATIRSAAKRRKAETTRAAQRPGVSPWLDRSASTWMSLPSARAATTMPHSSAFAPDLAGGSTPMTISTYTPARRPARAACARSAPGFRARPASPRRSRRTAPAGRSCGRRSLR